MSGRFSVKFRQFRFGAANQTDLDSNRPYGQDMVGLYKFYEEMACDSR